MSNLHSHFDCNLWNQFEICSKTTNFISRMKLGCMFNGQREINFFSRKIESRQKSPILTQIRYKIQLNPYTKFMIIKSLIQFIYRSLWLFDVSNFYPIIDSKIWNLSFFFNHKRFAQLNSKGKSTNFFGIFVIIISLFLYLSVENWIEFQMKFIKNRFN